MMLNVNCIGHAGKTELKNTKAVVFCKVGLRTLLPEISENLNKNKNEIPFFFIPSLRVLLLSLLVHMHLDIGNMTSANKPSQG